MGKPSGFLEWQRVLPKKRAVGDRLKDFRELYPPQPVEQARQQAGRCMDCGVPFCTQGCPLGNHIPDWNDLVHGDRWRDAWRRLAATNDFPEFTGRLCPAPCEGACVLAINTDAVTIEHIEKEIIERAFAEGWVQPAPPLRRTDKTVGVVGSGPAGLAAAAALNRAGHRVTVYEQADKIGGLLRYGIPDFKMEKWVIDRRLAVMEAEGVLFETGVDVGADGAPSWSDLRGRHDALLIAVGARRPRDLTVPGRDLGGVIMAMDYLEAQNRAVAFDEIVPPGLDVHGKRVIILGGGDTGSDCLGTALRQGAKELHQIELMPAPPQGRAFGNPWPQWPLIFRTSTSQEEGGERDFAVMTTRLQGEAGRLRALHAVRVEPRSSSTGPSFEAVDGSELAIPVDILILALGFTGPETGALERDLGLKLDPRGNVAIDEQYATSAPGVYCAGDAHRGASLIVWAIAEGREAARAIDSELRDGAAPWLPTRGVDLPFGGR
jgi:glutamate synthase (NADPH/NADH) small chain